MYNVNDTVLTLISRLGLLFQARLQEENVRTKEEINALVREIESSQGNLTQYTDRQAQAQRQHGELELVLSQTGKDLVRMQEQRDDATADKKAG